jgi:Pyruvate/2-oxoacid:ferredoxin oxidoreductase gamma subunit
MFYEVRFHGRGGQGAVMAAQALAVVASHDG